MKNDGFHDAKLSFEPQQTVSFFESETFSEMLYLHLFSNYLPVPNAPLLLGVHGPPGHGKTYQIEQLLQKWGVLAAYISGSELESDRAGEPSELVRRHYSELGAKLEETGRPAALVIDDIDAGIGDFGSRVTYTVNRQNISSALMNLCDRPESIKSKKVRRVPIIVTANNIDSLYEPLRRPSRMMKVHWEARGDDLKNIARTVFARLCDKRVSDALVAAFPQESPAFFQQVASTLATEQARRAFAGLPREKTLRYAILNPDAFRDQIGETDDDPERQLSRLLDIAGRMKDNHRG